MPRAHVAQRGFIAGIIGDGRPLLAFSAVSLLLVGVFALFLSATKHFLPHDVEYLGMDAADLCAIHECRIVHFMIHDRVSFGGVLVAIGIMYLWLAAFPLVRGEAWAWWTFAASGAAGFASFLAYLGYGYLDTWHGAATIALLPCFCLGLGFSFSHLRDDRPIRALARRGDRAPLLSLSRRAVGRLFLLAAAVGMVCGGLTIFVVEATRVFVPEDLVYMGLNVTDLDRINPRLIPLIAHDRAGFGGGVATAGLILFCCAWCSPMTRSLWQAIFLAGVVGFSTAIGIHPVIGYTDPWHLAPAVSGATLLAVGLGLTYRPWSRGGAGRLAFTQS